jgi:hypothetical protein
MNLKSIIVGAFVIALSVFGATESNAQSNARRGYKTYNRHYYQRPVVRERVIVRHRPVYRPIVRERVIVRQRYARPVVRERVVVHNYPTRRRY